MAPDFDTRLDILRIKSRQKEIELFPDVLELIARQIMQNIRELEGSLNRVIAYARLLDANPDVAMASKALESLALKAPEKQLNRTAMIINAVADSFNTSAADILGKSRDKETVLARRIAMYILRQETGLSLAQIGQELGGRDAAAVANGSKKVAAEIKSTSFIRDMVAEIQQKAKSAGC